MWPDELNLLEVSQENYTVMERVEACKATQAISHGLKIQWIRIKDCGGFFLTMNILDQMYFLQDRPLLSKQEETEKPMLCQRPEITNYSP